MLARLVKLLGVELFDLEPETMPARVSSLWCPRNDPFSEVIPADGIAITQSSTAQPSGCSPEPGRM